MTTKSHLRKLSLVKHILVMALLLALTSCGGGGESSPALRSDGTGTAPLELRCEAGDQVRVTVFVETPSDLVYGMHTRLRYARSLDLPGHADDQSVVDRVRFILPLPAARLDEPEGTSLHGMTVVNDQDTDLDGIDDRIQMLMITAFEAFPDGNFADVTFDCVTSIASPAADLFECEVAGIAGVDLDAFDDWGLAGASTCDVIAVPPAGP